MITKIEGFFDCLNKNYFNLILAVIKFKHPVLLASITFEKDRYSPNLPLIQLEGMTNLIKQKINFYFK